MSFILYGNQASDVHCDDALDHIFNYGLDRSGVIELMSKAIFTVLRMYSSNAAHTFLVFNNGARISDKEIAAMVEEATEIAKKKMEEENQENERLQQAQAKEAAERNKTLRRSLYDSLKLEFEITKESNEQTATVS
jgi:hypothetical protein